MNKQTDKATGLVIVTILTAKQNRNSSNIHNSYNDMKNRSSNNNSDKTNEKQQR